MGGVDLSDQLLNYFSFLRRSTKWSRKLLIHLFNLVILNAHILNKHYGCVKLTQDEYRGYIVKYLVSKGLKCYKIPLPSIISKKLGKHNTDEHNRTRLNERHFISNIPGGRVEKGRNHREIVLFAVEYQVLTWRIKELHFGVRTAGNHCVLCHVLKFIILKKITKNMVDFTEKWVISW